MLAQSRGGARRRNTNADPLARLGLPANTSDALYGLACTNFMAGRVWEAERLLHALLLLDPLKPQPYLGLGIIHSRRGDLRRACILFRTAVDCEPKWALAHFHLAATLLQQGDVTAAADALQGFFEHAGPDVPREIVSEAKRMRGFVARTTGQAADAEDAE